jgi:hypothetical protein
MISSNISPSLSYADGLLDSLTRSYNNIQKGDFEGAAKNVAEKLPFGREAIGYSKRITGSPILEDRPNYNKGGEVLDVPNAPPEPDQRIDKMTGMPYDQQAGTAFTDQEDRQDPLQRMGFGSGGAVQDPLQRMGFGAGSLVTRLGTKALRLFDDEVVEELPLKNTDELIEEGNKLSKALQDGEEAPSYVVEKSGDDLDAALKASSVSETSPAFFGFGKKPKVEKAEEAPVPKSLDEVSDDLAVNTEGKSLQEATRYVGIKGLEEGKEDYKIIADKVADQLDALEAKGFSFDYKIAQLDKDGRYVGPPDISRGGAAGLTNWKDKKTVVTINDLHPRDSLANGLNNKIILHESIHAATLAAIKVGRLKSQEGTKLNNDVVDLYKLFSYTVDNFNKKAKDPNSLEEFESKIFKRMNNSMKNPAEMVAWGLTDKDMQKYLESIPYKNTNAWTAFVQKIRDILGLSPKQDTVLSEILRVSDEILSTDVEQVSSVIDDIVRKQNYKGGKVLNSLRSKLNNV